MRCVGFDIKIIYKPLIILLALFLLLGWTVFYVNNLLSPPVTTKKGQQVVLKIPVNSNADKIGKILYEQGLIKSYHAFNAYVRYTGADNQLKAGEYKLVVGQTMPEIVQNLIKGSLNTCVVTIPEGFTVRQVADLLVNKGLVQREVFFKQSSMDKYSYPFLSGLAESENRLEGYLFPDTYYVSKNSGSENIINMMLSRFNTVITELNYEQEVLKMGLTLHEALTIASMIEREAKYDSERPLIAGVVFNRLKSGMPLQIDATVQYALGTNRSKLYTKDLQIGSPYNTYRINGLPPGPIASPGRASLLAVIKPEKTDYFYYVAKPDGTHAFSKTLAEHNKNVEKYIR